MLFVFSTRGMKNLDAEVTPGIFYSDLCVIDSFFESKTQITGIGLTAGKTRREFQEQTLLFGKHLHLRGNVPHSLSGDSNRCRPCMCLPGISVILENSNHRRRVVTAQIPSISSTDRGHCGTSNHLNSRKRSLSVDKTLLDGLFSHRSMIMPLLLSYGKLRDSVII